jgi:DNA-3-methyladenine glycosylase II
MNRDMLKCLNKDRKLKKIIPDLKIQLPDKGHDIYERLVTAIIYQQLAGAAADAIFGRLKKAFRNKVPSPLSLSRAPIEKLRAIGLSNQKANYVKNVANFWIAHKLKKKDWSEESNEEILKFLTQIKGVGPWTVKILMMFTMHRYDVFPTGDYGIQVAMQQIYNLKEEGKALKIAMEEKSKKWAPYQAIACLYLWAWLNKQKEMKDN